MMIHRYDVYLYHYIMLRYTHSCQKYYTYCLHMLCITMNNQKKKYIWSQNVNKTKSKTAQKLLTDECWTLLWDVQEGVKGIGSHLKEYHFYISELDSIKWITSDNIWSQKVPICPVKVTRGNSISQSEASIRVTWSAWTNQEPPWETGTPVTGGKDRLENWDCLLSRSGLSLLLFIKQLLKSTC